MARSSSPALAFDQEARITAINEALLEALGAEAAELYRHSIDGDLYWRDLAGNRFTFDGIRRMVRRGEVVHPFSADVAQPDGEFVRVTVTPSVLLGPGPLDFQLVLQLQPERRRRSTDRVEDPGKSHTTESGEYRLRVRAAAQGKLTPREIQVLKLLSEGASTKEMAEDLGISVSTVRNHVQSVLNKLEASSRVEAVARALRSRLI